jgi:hypothetical protein
MGLARASLPIARVMRGECQAFHGRAVGGGGAEEPAGCTAWGAAKRIRPRYVPERSRAMAERLNAAELQGQARRLEAARGRRACCSFP